MVIRVYNNQKLTSVGVLYQLLYSKTETKSHGIPQKQCNLATMSHLSSHTWRYEHFVSKGNHNEGLICGWKLSGLQKEQWILFFWPIHVYINMHVNVNVNVMF